MMLALDSENVTNENNKKFSSEL